MKPSLKRKGKPPAHELAPQDPFGSTPEKTSRFSRGKKAPKQPKPPKEPKQKKPKKQKQLTPQEEFAAAAAAKAAAEAVRRRLGCRGRGTSRAASSRAG